MNKKEFFVSCWVPIAQRLPPETDIMVLVWNWLHKEAYFWEGYLARAHALAELGKCPFNTTGDDLSRDRRISHWMHIFGPRNETMHISTTNTFRVSQKLSISPPQKPKRRGRTKPPAV